MTDIKLFTKEESKEVLTISNLLMNPPMMVEFRNMCEALSSQSGVVPDHFVGKPNDVMAVIMQASRWGLDPFTVLQSTFVLQGKIGYEAKIVQSVASANGGLVFDTEYFGDWTRINGNTRKIKKTKTGRNGPYTVDVDIPNWTAQDEVGVGIKCTGTFPDGRKVDIEVSLNTCYPRHSTNWTYDPMTQIHYTAIKRFVRRFAPHLIAGIRDYDDLSAASDQHEKKLTLRLSG